MRIARFQSGDSSTTGIVVGDRVVSLTDLGLGPEADAVTVLEQGRSAWERLGEEAAALEGVAITDVELLAPIPRPGKFLAIGMNSEDHMREAATAPRTPEILEMLNAYQHVQQGFPKPRWPLIFNKQTSSIAGPRSPIWIPFDSPQVDYEGEVVVVIGDTVRRADEAQAEAAIAAWMVTNDVTVREWQWNTSQVWLGKSFDTHGPTGPWLVTADEFDPESAVIRTWVNDDLRQEGKLSEQILSPAKLVSQISHLCTLEPGDLIATGTPGGVGTASGRYLVPGDRVRIEVSGIGQIDNAVIAEPLTEKPALVEAAAG